MHEAGHAPLPDRTEGVLDVVQLGAVWRRDLQPGSLAESR